MASGITNAIGRLIQELELLRADNERLAMILASLEKRLAFLESRPSAFVPPPPIYRKSKVPS